MTPITPTPRISVQPIFDELTNQRRLFETYSPATHGRLFIKRSTTPEEAKQKLSSLELYMKQLHALVSPNLCSFTGRPHFPARLLATKTFLSHLEYPKDPLNRCVLCHGDIGWQNVMVDPDTGDIKSIIDWEYAGFNPVEVEGEYWRRWGTANHNGSN
ncbi:hypothetical protein IAT40_004000 [Kwoniella sp. CBS 6097]